MELKDQVQGVVLGLFGAYAGAHLADLTAQAEAGNPVALVEGLVNLQPVLLGADLNDDATWVDLILGHMGIASTSAAYDAAADWANGELAAGATRAEVIIAAVTYLLGDTVEAQYADVAAAFQADVAAGIEWSEGDGADVLGIADLRAEAGNVVVFNLTAALATLDTTSTAVESFLKALDLDGDGKADNAGATQVANNRAELTKVAANGAGAYDVALNAVDDIVAANSALNDDDWYALTAAQQAAELAKVKVTLAAEVTNAQTDVDTAYAALSAGLKTAITNYEAAVATQKAAVTAEGKTDADLTAAIAKYNLDSADDINFVVTTDSSAVTKISTAGAVDLITIDGAKYTAALATGVTETTNPGISAVLSALQADLAAEKSLATANTALGTAQVALDLADGGADDGVLDSNDGGDDDFGEANDPGTFDVAVDAPSYDAYLGFKTTLKNAETAVSDLDKAVAKLDAVKAEVTALAALDKAQAAAENAIGASGYDLNNANGQYDSNTDGDYTDAGEFDFSSNTAAAELAEKEVYTIDYGNNAVAAFQAGDVIVVSGFTYNDGDVATDGNNSVLEFFLEETVGGDLLVHMEQEVFGSNSAAMEYTTITLTGVTLEDVVVGTNYITLA